MLTKLMFISKISILLNGCKWLYICI